MRKPSLAAALLLLPALAASPACFAATAAAQDGAGSVQQAVCDAHDSLAAEVRGRVRMDAGTPGPTRVFLFDGRDLHGAAASSDGSFCLPVPRSVAGSFVSVFVVRDFHTPHVRNLRLDLDGDTSLTFGPEVLAVSPVALGRTANAGLGTLTGVAYIQHVGGRPRPLKGILSFDADLGLSIQRQVPAGTRVPAPVRLRTTSTGAFTVQLPPGLYRIVTSRNVVVDSVQIQTGRTTVVPVFSGQRISF